MMSERRRYKRKPWEHAISFQLGPECRDVDKGITYHGKTVDIGAGGLCLISDRLLSPGLSISFGDTKLAGVVRWSCGEGDSYSSGIQLS
jgi:hypothetical protein